MKYTIVYKKTIHEAMNEIIGHVNMGWIPIGGIAFDGNYYLQSMTRS